MTQDEGWIRPPDGLALPANATEMAAAGAALGETLLKRHGRMELACIVMVDKAGHLGEVLFDIPERKKDLAALIDRLTTDMKSHGVVCYAFMMEAWFRGVARAGLAAALKTPVSQSPDRREALLVLAQSQTEDIHMALPLLRDAEGQFLGLGRNILRIGQKSGIPFGSLLRPITMH